MYKHDFIGLSRANLDYSTHNGLFEVNEYNLVHADHPNNIKRGGVCIHFKESHPVQFISLLYLKEVLLLEMTYNNKKVLVSIIYSSPI